MHLRLGLDLAAAAAVALSAAAPGAALARDLEEVGPDLNKPDRCSVERLSDFRDFRENYSLEVAGGSAPEAEVDVRGCDFSGLDLHGATLSAINAAGASFEGSDLSDAILTRAYLRRANLKGANLTSATLYETQLQGADVRDASFENALMSGVFFGKDEGQVDAHSNEFAQMEGANLDAIFSRSDVRELCTNPTLDDMQKGFYLGC
eukprot:PRCOL_00006085-RA